MDKRPLEAIIADYNKIGETIKQVKESENLSESEYTRGVYELKRAQLDIAAEALEGYGVQL